MIDIGIDWHAIMREERLGRMAVSPFFEEAGTLLLSAQALWPGRVRGRELGELGRKFRGAGYDWRSIGSAWADSPMAPAAPGEAIGPILHQFRERRSFKIEGVPTTNAAAARRLTEAGLSLVCEAIPVIRKTGKRYENDREADGWEDLLEVIAESPCAAPPPTATPLEAYRALRERAVCRICESLAHTTAYVVMFRGGLGEGDKKKDAKKKARHDKWFGVSSAWRKRGDAAYVRFAELAAADADERAALLAAMDTAIPYIEFADAHYASDAAVLRVEWVVETLTGALFRIIEVGDGAENPDAALAGPGPRLIGT